jgi:hypothetical protein
MTDDAMTKIKTTKGRKQLSTKHYTENKRRIP